MNIKANMRIVMLTFLYIHTLSFILSLQILYCYMLPVEIFVYIAKWICMFNFNSNLNSERKWKKTKQINFTDLCWHANHNVSNIVHIAKCRFCTERIALTSSSKELHQILDALSNRYSSNA